MKSLILFAIFALSCGLAAANSFDHGATGLPVHNYKCIADTLQAIDGDLYYNLSAEEIATILVDSTDARYATTVKVADQCDFNK